MTEYNKTCPYCKKLFTTNRSNKYYCSPSCRTMASRKGYKKFEYPNQLEIGLERHIRSLVDRLIRFESSGISNLEIVKLQHECMVIRAFTMDLVNPENIYFRCFYDVIEPFLCSEIIIDKNYQGMFDFNIPHEYYNRLEEI